MPANQESEPCGRVGVKPAAEGAEAVAASQHPRATDAMLAVLREGGSAADAAVAAALVHGTVQQEMTNHAGSLSLLYYEAANGEVHELNSGGTLAGDIAPVFPIPRTQPGSDFIPMVPGLMPGLKTLHERFGTLPWARLCEPAIEAAEQGHTVTTLEHRALVTGLPPWWVTASGRAHFAPGGHLPQVGTTWRQPELAATLRLLAADGPNHFINGGWARAFVARAHELGWPVTLEHLAANEPRWAHGTRWTHRGHEIVQLSPPETQAVRSALVLGVLDEVDVLRLGHPSRNAESMYYLAHALRLAGQAAGYVHDPVLFDSPVGTLLSRDYHRLLARILHDSRPHADLRSHLEITGRGAFMRTAGAPREQRPSSCELTAVDRRGNWVQAMHTLTGGGLPGEVIGGVPMAGGNPLADMSAWYSGWFHPVPTRVSSPIGNTMVLRDGHPWLSLGTPGKLWDTVAQVLSNILDFGMDPSDAEEPPLIRALTDDYVVPVEARLPSAVIAGLAERGVSVHVEEPYDWHMGSFQIAWRSPGGRLRAIAGRRREGKAAAY